MREMAVNATLVQKPCARVKLHESIWAEVGPRAYQYLTAAERMSSHCFDGKGCSAACDMMQLHELVDRTGSTFPWPR
jgi:hypothetical protein